MIQNDSVRVIAKLRALFDVIADEARANPAFATKVETSLASVGERKQKAGAQKQTDSSAAPSTKLKESEAHKMLHNVTFDPLECHIEAAILNGREQEARAFLGKLDRAQLEEVVKVQRLPGAKTLQKTIQEEDAASAVNAIVGSAAERVRNRYSAAN
jgi:hypothetical protein